MPTPKGSKLSPEHRRKIGEGVRNSEKYQKGIRNRKRINPFVGHNYGECTKCGKTHIHPMKGKHHSEETKRKIGNANRGRESVWKGKHFSFEHRQNIAKSKRGKRLSAEHKRNIARGVKNSRLHHDHVREYHRQRAQVNEEKVKAFLRELYDISEKAGFYPASKYEHQFSRRVLIERSHCYGFITQSGLPAIPDWLKGEMAS